MSSRAERIVETVLSELQGSPGFDHWWDMVDKEDRDEIRLDLVEIVTAELIS